MESNQGSLLPKQSVIHQAAKRAKVQLVRIWIWNCQSKDESEFVTESESESKTRSESATESEFESKNRSKYESDSETRSESDCIESET